MTEMHQPEADVVNLKTHRASSSVWEKRGWDGQREPPALTRILVGVGGGALAVQGLRLNTWTGRVLAGLGGTLGAPMLNAYPGLDTDMLPLALIVVILGGAGSLLGAFVGSFVVGFLYNFGIALFPDLAYFILFLPMVLVLVFMPQGLFGRVPS